MSIETTHICDGCGSRVTSDDPPAMWKRVEVNVRTDVAEDIAAEGLFYGCFDLCEICLDRLEREFNPKAWKRPANEVDRN